MNIIVCGPSFVGKSTIGKEIARQLAWEFVDIDSLLVARFNMSCTVLFKQIGNLAFRMKENEALSTLTNTSKKVIGLGGGTLTYEPNAATVKSLGFLVYLSLPFNRLLERLFASGRIPGYLDPQDLEGSYKKITEMRLPTYEKNANFTLDTFNKNPQECASLIIDEYKRHYG